jgi:hypothetical protein
MTKEEFSADLMEEAIRQLEAAAIGVEYISESEHDRIGSVVLRARASYHETYVAGFSIAVTEIEQAASNVPLIERAINSVRKQLGTGQPEPQPGGTVESDNSAITGLREV